MNKMEYQLVTSAGGGGDDENNRNNKNHNLYEMAFYSSFVPNEDEQNEEDDEDELGMEASQNKGLLKRKRKVNWTDSLHKRFLKALNTVGPHNAVPRKIWRVMNVPGLTRINVGSHLQKYRIFLERVSEIGIEKLLNPSVTRPPGPRLNRTFLKFLKESAQHLPEATRCNGASTSTPESGPFGQSQPTSNPGNIQTPNTDSTSLINPANDNGWFSEMVNNNNQQNNNPFQFQGDLSMGLSGSFGASGSTSTASDVLANWNLSHTSNNEVSHSTNNATTSTPTSASEVFANWNWSNMSYNEVSHDKNNATSSSTPTNTSNMFVDWNSCITSYNEVVPDTNNASISTTSELEYKNLGYTIADVERFLESEPEVEGTSSNVDVAAPVSTNDSHMDLDPMASSMPFSAYFAPDYDTNASANDQYFLSDVGAEYYQTFQPSDHLQEHFQENVESGGQMEEFEFTHEQLMLNLEELGVVIPPIDEPEGEGDRNFVVGDHQVNAQNPPLEQIIGGEDIGTSSSQGVGMTLWDNNASSNLEQVPNQGEEDDLLESLLAASELYL